MVTLPKILVIFAKIRSCDHKMRLVITKLRALEQIFHRNIAARSDFWELHGKTGVFGSFQILQHELGVPQFYRMNWERHGFTA